MGLLKNRLNIAADIYWRNNFDLIGAAYTIGGLAGATSLR